MLLLQPMLYGVRLLMLVEYGWDLIITCRACGAAQTWRRDQLLDQGARLQMLCEELQPTLRCSACGIKGEAMLTARGGAYQDLIGKDEPHVRRWRLIRELLTARGIDPSTFGYGETPPVRDPAYMQTDETADPH